MEAEQKRALLAVLLSGLVLFAWQAWFAPQLPSSKAPVLQKSPPIDIKDEAVRKQALEAPPEEDAQKEIVAIQKGETLFQMSNFLTIENIVTENAVSRFEEIVGLKSPFSIELLTKEGPRPLIFQFSSFREGNRLSGRNAAYEIDLNIHLDEKGKLFVSLHSPHRYRYRISFFSEEKDIGNNRIREFVALKGGDVGRHTVGDDENDSGSFQWLGLDFNYHLFIWGQTQKATPLKYQMMESGKIVVDTLEPSNFYEGYFIFTKKNYDDLVSLGDNLHLAVDFGLFGILAVPILRGLQFFYKYVANFGISIIIVTLIIRLLTFPLQYKSFKSMKKMQQLQPEMAKLKEKYKDDPKRMQQETMELFKRAGANPLGGCFPMLLQMPIFFAFYQVLNNAVELVGAPFYFWITDLSLKDPYYVLPLLMMITMFAQTKMNPGASTDPTQKKIMYLMPLIFGFIMKDLPAGLNLYITVSILFGIVQQLFVYKATD